MAITYQSIQSNTAVAPSGSVVVTKPVSLAVGDLMIAGMVGLTGSNSTPSGWTVIRSQTANAAITTTFYKVATSTDVAASNFTFTNSANRGLIAFITRWTGTIAIDQNNGSELTGTASYSSSGITPTYANSIFLILTAQYTSGATRTVSAQAIATNNPSWTEILDTEITADGTDHIGLGVAYALRPETTGSGNATATASGSCDNAKLQVFNLDPRQFVDVSDSIAITDALSISKGTTVSVSDTVSISDAQTTKYGWVNDDKSSAPTWVNEDKS